MKSRIMAEKAILTTSTQLHSIISLWFAEKKKSPIREKRGLCIRILSHSCICEKTMTM